MGGSGSNRSPEKDRPSALHSPSERTGTLGDILIVEDNSADVFLIRAAIKAAQLDANLHFVTDGEQAVRFFDQADSNNAAPCPSLVVLDINLPRKQGGEVLQHLRRSRRCANALVIAVSTSESPRDRADMIALGAADFFRKPSDYDDFMKLGDMIKRLLSGGA